MAEAAAWCVEPECVGRLALNGKGLARMVNDISPDFRNVLTQRERSGSVANSFGEVFAV
ncbi:hypothetical protein [Streptosporangium vulgare]|uniref:Uncharacterized protein n=1 Tax=Streptosporangium vulgare TaxID=46190 RepID=A0ABV5TQS7_9ACTN